MFNNYSLRDNFKNLFFIIWRFFLFFIAIIFIIILINIYKPFFIFSAGTNIDNNYRYAWNNVIGWIDFYVTQNVNVSSTQLTGYAESNLGIIALDCATAPNPDCSINYKVLNNNGLLSGWAWNDAIGWISFCGGENTANCPGSVSYRVSINPSTGDFYGWAWNDTIGWISFNCSNYNGCVSSDYKVKTQWRAVPLVGELISSIYDTQIQGGAGINTIMWNGVQPDGTRVYFQIASSNSSSGPWAYLGPDGSSSSYYIPTNPNKPVKINMVYHNNHRYFRYKIFLESDISQTASPLVDDVIINWSP
jgi:hypothetical protein